MSTDSFALLTTNLRHHIGALGKQGGVVSPAIYDTAQLIRFYPPVAGVWPALNWLLSQQQADGGWGNPAVPRARDVPTLAAILALHTYGKRASDRAAVEAGKAFLLRQATYWRGTLPDDLPVGIELVLPCLLDDAAAAGLNVPQEHFAALRAQGARRRRLLDSHTFPPGTPPLHSWESFGATMGMAMLDRSGGVGHSPAATAAWLRATAGRDDLADAHAATSRYLQAATAACGGVPGIVPTVWPIGRFEQIFALYFLLLTGLLDHPALADVIRPQIDDLERAFTARGIGMSDDFIPDGDDTAVALAVLHAAGRDASLGVLNSFAYEDGSSFITYHGELHAGISVTIHALHALRIAGAPSLRVEGVLAAQGSDGRWLGDKWHQSWLYTTSQALLVLDDHHLKARQRAVAAVLAYQNVDGGWGMGGSTTEETAYGILALRAGSAAYTDGEIVRRAIGRATTWLRAAYQPLNNTVQPIWVGKELFRPHRLAHIIILAVLTQAEMNRSTEVGV